MSETMSRNEVFQKMKEILVADFEMGDDAVTLDAELYSEMDLDSIDVVDLIVKMKEYIPGKIDPAVFKTAKTMSDLVEILYSLIQEGAPAEAGALT